MSTNCPAFQKNKRKKRGLQVSFGSLSRKTLVKGGVFIFLLNFEKKKITPVRS